MKHNLITIIMESRKKVNVLSEHLIIIREKECFINKNGRILCILYEGQRAKSTAFFISTHTWLLVFAFCK